METEKKQQFISKISNRESLPENNQFKKLTALHCNKIEQQTEIGKVYQTKAGKREREERTKKFEK